MKQPFELRAVMGIASAVVHFLEFHGGNGHAYDLEAAKNALTDPETKKLLCELEADALLPVRRDGVRFSE